MIAEFDAEIRTLQDALMKLESEATEKRLTLRDLIRRRNAMLMKATTAKPGVQHVSERDVTA